MLLFLPFKRRNLFQGLLLFTLTGNVVILEEKVWGFLESRGPITLTSAPGSLGRFPRARFRD